MLHGTARALEIFYWENCYVRTSRFVVLRFMDVLDRPENEAHFQAAADACDERGIPPKDYMRAQFAAFDVHSARMGRTLMPQPCHIKGQHAMERYEAWAEDPYKGPKTAAEAIARHKRTSRGGEQYFDPEKQVEELHRETRKLKGLATLLKLPELEVLRRHAREFSQEFIAAAAA